MDSVSGPPYTQDWTSGDETMIDSDATEILEKPIISDFFRDSESTVRCEVFVNAICDVLLENILMLVFNRDDETMSQHTYVQSGSLFDISEESEAISSLQTRRCIYFYGHQISHSAQIIIDKEADFYRKIAAERKRLRSAAK